MSDLLNEKMHISTGFIEGDFNGTYLFYLQNRDVRNFRILEMIAAWEGLGGAKLQMEVRLKDTRPTSNSIPAFVAPERQGLFVDTLDALRWDNALPGMGGAVGGYQRDFKILEGGSHPILDVDLELRCGDSIGIVVSNNGKIAINLDGIFV